MQLDKFNGGLQIRKARHRLDPSEAVKCINVDTSTEAITSVKGPVPTVALTGSNPFYFNAEQRWLFSTTPREYLEYQGALYWTAQDAISKLVNSKQQNLGIVAPTVAPTVTSVGPVPVTGVTVTPVPYELKLNLEMSSDLLANLPDFVRYYYKLILAKDGLVVAAVTNSIELIFANAIAIATAGVIPAGYTVTVAREYEGVWRQIYTGAVHTSFILDTTLDISTAPEVDVALIETALLKDASMSIGFSTVLGELISEPAVHTVTLLADSYLELRAPIAGNWYIRYGNAWRLIGTTAEVTFFFLDLSAATWEDLGVTGTVQYVYTYYNSLDGTESAPSPLSPEHVVANAKVTVQVTQPTDTQVTHINLYRIGGNVLDFTKVTQLKLPESTYVDSQPAQNLSGNTLDSELHQPPPTGLRYLTASQGTFFGAVGAKLYFAKAGGNPNYWPGSYYIDMPATITGIAEVAAGTLVFTRYRTYLVTGTTVDAIAMQLVSADQGCIAHATITSAQGGALFVSTDGICSSQGGAPEVISRHALGKVALDAITAVTFDDAYYLQLRNGTILVLDLRYKPNIREYNFLTEYIAVGEDNLWAVKQKQMCTLFLGDPAKYEYETGELVDGSRALIKLYDHVFIAATGTHTVTVKINNAVVHTQELVGDKLHDVRIPQVKMRGEAIAFHLTGVGEVREIIYNAEVQKNA